MRVDEYFGPTLQGVDAEEELDNPEEGSESQEAQAPGRAKEEAEAPDAEEGDLVLLPLWPAPDTYDHQSQHKQSAGEDDCEEAHVDDVVDEEALFCLNPAPANYTEHYIFFIIHPSTYLFIQEQINA